MTENEVNEAIERILDLYISEVKAYYNKPKYTDRPRAHTMLIHLFDVMEQTKKKFIEDPSIEIMVPGDEDWSDLLKGSV